MIKLRLRHPRNKERKSTQNAIVTRDFRRVDYWTAETAVRAAEAWNETAVADIICVCPACPVRAHNNAHCLRSLSWKAAARAETDERSCGYGVCWRKAGMRASKL